MRLAARGADWRIAAFAGFRLRPCEQIRLLQQEARAAIHAPAGEVKAKLEEFGLVGVASTPAEFRKFIDDDITFQARVLKLARIEKQ